MKQFIGLFLLAVTVFCKGEHNKGHSHNKDCGCTHGYVYDENDEGGYNGNDEDEDENENYDTNEDYEGEHGVENDDYENNEDENGDDENDGGVHENGYGDNDDDDDDYEYDEDDYENEQDHKPSILTFNREIQRCGPSTIQQTCHCKVNDVLVTRCLRRRMCKHIPDFPQRGTCLTMGDIGDICKRYEDPCEVRVCRPDELEDDDEL